MTKKNKRKISSPPMRKSTQAPPYKTVDVKKDPFREREAEKYQNPIPSREFILEHLEELGRPASFGHFLRSFSLHEDEQKEALHRRLRAMLRDGQLLSNRRGSFALASQMELLRGRVTVHKEGYGFLLPEDGKGRIFLPPGQLHAVFHGDKVLVSIAKTDTRGRREGLIVEILERGTKQTVGRYLEEDGIAFVASSNKNVIHDVLIPKGKEGGAKLGDIVVADIVSYPSLRRQAIGEVVEVLGEHMAPGLEIDIAIRSHSLPHSWPKEVLEEANSFSRTVTAKDCKGRRDLRDLPFVTIDGEDARDFDDAVYCKANPKGGWQLFVAIADVSHYVRENTALDREALQRGNSVYFPRQVIPMLPEVLSNELCSLKPNVLRLAFVCEMSISATGIVKRYSFYDAVILSCARLTYNEVFAMLEGNSAKNFALLPFLKELYSVYKALRKQRKVRGALEIESSETKIIFGKNRKIKKIVPREHSYAHEIIEECMLAANVCSSKFLISSKLPFLFRVHASPEHEKLENFRLFLRGLGLKLEGGNNPGPIDYAKLIDKTKGRLDRSIIQSVLLRSLQQAIYTPENKGHFGLAYKSYSHFTSPIRRYPDLLNHRAIRHALKNGSRESYAYGYSMMQNFGEHCSMTERRADEATRGVVDWLKCEYMLNKIGKTYDGRVSGVMNFGLFVELKDVYVEGLLHITSLKNDYYRFDPLHHCLEGKRSGAIYRLGDPIKVLVACVNLEEREIDFELVE